MMAGSAHGSLCGASTRCPIRGAAVGAAEAVLAVVTLVAAADSAAFPEVAGHSAVVVLEAAGDVGAH